jgi:hypothetical protein
MVRGKFDAFAEGSIESLDAIFTRSGSELAFIFCIAWPRCDFTVISLMPRT